MRCRFAPCFAVFALFALLFTAAVPSTFAAGALTGTSTAITTAQAFNLTSQGTGDWAHWGTSTATSFDHKTSGSTSISNYALVGAGTVARYTNNLTGYTWTDGTPTTSATNSTTGIYVAGTNNGFSFTVPAGTTSRTLTVYVGGYLSDGKLTAHLSDGSATDFTDSSYGYNLPGNINSKNYLPVYTLAYNAASTGQTLTVKWVQTAGTGNVTLQSAALTPAAPAAPTNLVATPISPTQINLTWTASTGATSYNIKRGTVSGGPYTTVGTSTTASFSDTGLTAATHYYYVVTAVNGGSESVPSSEVLRTTLCVAPTNLTATATSTQIGLTWTASVGATSYSLYRGTSSGGEGATAYQTGLTGTSATDTSVTAGTTYYYTVKAINNGGTSAASNETPATVISGGFQLSVYPLRLTTTQGASNTVTLSVVPTGGFSGTVTLTNSALPNGVTLAYAPNPIPGSSTPSMSVLTFTATASAALGQTSVTITGTSGSVTSTIVIPLTIAPVVSGSGANIAVASGTGELSAVAGSGIGASTSLTVTPVNSYTGLVSFAATGLPSGVSVVTNPATVSITGTAAQTSTVTFQAASAVTPGYYAIGITGSGSGGATNTTVVGLNVLPPVNSLPFTLTVTDSATNAIPNGTASAVVTLTTTGGYSRSITLSLADDPLAPVLGPSGTLDPTKIAVAFSNASLSVSGSSALTLAVGASVAPGGYHFVVTGLSTDGSVQYAAFTLFIAPEGVGTDPSIDGSGPSQTYTGDSPPYPLAASPGDMRRFDFDPGSVFEIGSGGHIPPAAAPLLGLHPNNAPLGLYGLPDGTDDRKYVAATIPPPYVYPYRACVRIKAFWTSTIAQVGSGTLIGKNHILTAAHIIYDPILGLAKTIYVMPGYDYNWSKTHSLTYTTVNHGFIASGYFLGAIYASHSTYKNIYDDWAVLDCNPITNGPPGQRGGPIGNYSQYMQLDNTGNVTLPETNTHIAGYTAFTWAPASPVLTGGLPGCNPDLFETYVYNGDDGPVDASPEASLISESPDLLFSTMDFSSGDSGAGLWYFSDEDSDYHIYGVVDAIVAWNDIIGNSGFSGASAQITGTRYSIIKTQEKLDGDEPPDVYTP